MPDLTAETLAMLANDERTIRDVLDDGILDAPEVLSSKRQLELTAHAAACVRFVAALTNREITTSVANTDHASHRFVVTMANGVSVLGPSPLAAFRAATQDHHTGGDDGQ